MYVNVNLDCISNCIETYALNLHVATCWNVYIVYIELR